MAENLMCSNNKSNSDEYQAGWVRIWGGITEEEKPAEPEINYERDDE